MHDNPATPDHEIHPLLSQRWSPRVFSDRPVELTKLAQLLEAARWSASSFNEQPWRFVVAPRQDEAAFSRLLSCLTSRNQSWAQGAAALLLSVARQTFAHNDKLNRHAWHDVGLATAQLIVQAEALGMRAHPMAGFDSQRTRDVLAIPEGYEPVAVVALGYPRESDSQPGASSTPEGGQRTRKSLSEFAFFGRFGEPLEGVVPAQAEEVLAFWFGELDELGRATEEQAKLWWKKDPAFDDQLRRKFGGLHQAVVAGEREHWLTSARGRLAHVIVLDQLSRNMFRGSAGMFAHDAQALAAALGAVDRGLDRALPTDMRIFCYMPTMHSEEIAVQDRGVELFAALVAESSEELRPRIERNLKYARMHRDIVARFGRFPHRNELLGRATTDEEREFLKQPGSSF
jgi:uncharacterized protein (DUF924 family)/nitroreductase